MAASLLIIVLFCSSCSKKIITPTDLPKNNVSIGSYGGFTGLNEKLIFLKNGQVYTSEKMPGGQANIKFQKQITRKEARAIFKTFSKINFKLIVPDNPGNINTYIERNRLLRKDNYFEWSGNLDSSNTNYKYITKLLTLQN